VIFRILGSGTLIPSPERGPAGFLLTSGRSRLLIDGGSGTIAKLSQAGVDARYLDGILYSHRHIDHCGDLVPILFAMSIPIDQFRDRDLPIWAGKGFAAFLVGLQSFWDDWITPKHFAIGVHEMPLDKPGLADLPGDLHLDTLPAIHEDGAIHMAFTGPGGVRIVYSGDTGVSEGLVSLADHADLLICECGAREGSTYPNHLTPSDVAALVDAARPDKVVLTHLYPSTDVLQAREIVARTGVETFLGVDGQEYRLGSDAV